MIAGGAGGSDRLLTVTVGQSTGSDVEDGPGGAVDGRGATANATSAAANEAEAGGHMGRVSSSHVKLNFKKYRLFVRLKFYHLKNIEQTDVAKSQRR